MTWENKNVGFPSNWLLDAFFLLILIMILNNSPLSAFSKRKHVCNHLALSLTLKRSMHIWPTLLAPLEATLLKILVSVILEKYASSVPQNLLCCDRHFSIPVLPLVSSYAVMWILLKEQRKLSVVILLTCTTNID